ncbi:hypothetical protein HYDPIDRAFT_108266 [Hydnomerulius pinastri MD-312]|nr:hypothetical protein HYDPIDRAFT_108266 [Hydnomerulius pinastri MD-312]
MPKLWFLYLSRPFSMPMSITLENDGTDTFDFEDLRPIIAERIKRGKKATDPEVGEDDFTFWKLNQSLETDSASPESANESWLKSRASRIGASARVSGFASSSDMATVRLVVWDTVSQKAEADEATRRYKEVYGG